MNHSEVTLRRYWVLALSLVLFLSTAIFRAGPAYASPAAPTGLSVLNGNGEATLSWNASTGASYYLLYRATASGGPYTFVAQTGGLSHTDRGLTSGTTYRYVVTALNSSGQSVYSSEASATPTLSLLPAPANVKAFAGNGQVSLTWDGVTSAVGYNVYRSTTAGGPYTLLTPAAHGPSFTDTGLTNSTRYFYVIQTMSPDGGAYSGEVSVVPSTQLSVAPTNFSATPGSTWAQLSWSASTGATGYAVFRGTSVGGPYNLAGYTPTTGYEETGLTNGTTYFYVVAAVNANGRGAFSAEQSAAVSDIAMPHATVLKASLADSGQITLNWNTSAGAVSYEILRSTTPGGPYTSLGVWNSGYTDKGLSNGATYYYVVDAHNSSPIVSRSNEVALAPVAGGVPSAPGNVAVIPGNTQATVTWDPVPGATGYSVTVANSPGGQAISVGGINMSGPGCTVTGLTNGQAYYFRVQASASGWSAYSSEVSTTPSGTLLLAPTGSVNITGGNTQLSLTWNTVADATGYQVFRRVDGTAWPAAPVATVNGTLYTDKGLVNGTTYQYVVAAVNAAGTGARSAMASGTPAAAGFTIAPQNVAVTPGNTAATVTWDPVPGASGYSVTVSSSLGGPALNTGGYQMGPSYTVTGLTNTETYYFRVQASAIGWSAFSDEASTTLPTTLPTTPSGLNITGGNSQLSLTWTKMTGATGYQVFRRNEGEPWPVTPVATTTGTLFNDSGLFNGANYQYVVAAVNASGTGARSSMATGTPAAGGVTLAPVNVEVIPGNTQATVTWDPVPGANGYSVTVSESPGGPAVSSGGYQAGSGYTVTGLTNGKAYYFRVQASGSGWSAFSAEVSATPSVSQYLAPTGLNISSGNTQLTLTWSAVPGASTYNVYRRTAGNAWPATPVATPATNSFTDTGLVNGTTYYYVVASAGGAWSQEASGIPADTTPPDTTITGEPTNPSTSITAGFTFTSTKSGSTFQCRMDNGAYEACASPKSYSGLAAGSHTFSVKATDSVGNTDPSPASYTWTINTTITVPVGTITINNGATVTDKTLVNLSLSCTDPDGCSQMQFSNDGNSWSTAESYTGTKSWTITSGDGEKTVYVKFKDTLEYWSNVFSSGILLNTAGKTLIVNRTGTGSGTVTSAPAGISCGATCQSSFASSTAVTLNAVADAGSVFAAWGGDCTGVSPTTSITVNKTMICTARFDNTAPTPAAPAGLSVVSGNGEATISWNASTGATRYLLYRATSSGGSYTLVAETVGLSHTDRGLSNGSPYYYVVTALNSSGQSAYSSELPVVSTASVLPAPVNVKAVAGNGQASLTWDSVTSGVVYNVYRSTTPGGPYTLLTPAAPGPSFTDSGLTNGIRYYYVVQTLSTDSGAYSGEVSVVPSIQLPAAPTNFVAEPGSTWSRLGWDAVSGATGYAVFRGTSVGGPYNLAGYTPTTGYEETGLTNGTTYYYVVAAVNANGRGAFSLEQSADVSEIAMPHAVVLKASLAGDGQITLNWDNTAGATSYIIRRSNTPGGPYTSLGVQNSGYTDNGLINGTTYYYVVDALNSSSVVPRSNEVALAPVAGGVPSAPGNVAVIPGNTQATVTWNPVPGATGYSVTVSTSPGGQAISVGGINMSGPSCTVTGLTNAQAYYFRVQSSASGWSAYSSEVSTIPSDALPVAPTGLNTTGGSSQLSLTWNKADGATGYQVFRRVDGTAWPAAPVATVNGTLYTDKGIANGTTYQYVVAAVNAAGVGARSTMASGTPAAAGYTIAPQNVAVTPGNTQATLTWDPVPGATGYSVKVSSSPGGPVLNTGGYQMGPSYTVTGLTNTGTYYFRVQASASGWSAFSDEVSTTLPTTLPTAPTGLNITGGNSELSLTWNKVTGATGYQVFRRNEGEPWPVTPVAITTGTLFNDSGLFDGANYQYVVAAVNVAGAGAHSSIASATPAAAGLTLAPVNLSVIPGNTQATLTWNPVPGANGYSVMVSDSPGGPSVSVGGYQMGPSYTVTGLTNGKTYYFRVQASCSGWSAFSDEVNATPTVTRLPAPTGLGITSGIGQITLNWTAVEGATEYKIYRRTDGTGYVLIGSTFTNSFTDSALIKDTRFYYVVEPVNLAGPGAWSQEISAVPVDVPMYTLSTTINGSGSINNLAQPPSFSCDSSNCAASFYSGTQLILSATPSSLYSFDGWSGACSGTGDCTLTIAADTGVTATFTALPLVRVSGSPTPYYMIMTAYGGTSANSVFSLRNIIFNENVILNKAISITLNGGLDSDFSTVNGYSTIDGYLQVNSGSVTVNRLVIR